MKTYEIGKIIEEVKENCDYAYIGIRTQEEPFVMGCIDHASSVWEDGEETGELLDGISCTDVESPAISMHCEDYDKRMGFYFGGHVAIVGSTKADFCEDLGELIMKDAEVLMIIK